MTGTLPIDGCMRFGPDTPPGGFRPRDPDATGGFYQPVRVDAAEPASRSGSRASRASCRRARRCRARLRLHTSRTRNPTLDPIALAQCPADSDVTLTASWPADSVESYLYYDAVSQTLVTRREAMRVSWFATAGTLAVDATAVGEDDPATTASTTWHTPATPGPVWLWLVLRDSRGGLATQGRLRHDRSVRRSLLVTVVANDRAVVRRRAAPASCPRPRSSGRPGAPSDRRPTSGSRARAPSDRRSSPSDRCASPSDR